MRAWGAWIAVLVVGATGWKIYGDWEHTRAAGRWAAEQDARGRYAHSRMMLRGPGDPADLEWLRIERQFFMSACRECASWKRCEADARDLDSKPETARLASACP